MRVFALSIALLSTCIAGRGAHAQEPDVPSVDPAVETVVSGGAWSTRAARGRYRVIVVAEGWEEVRHRAILQWVEEPGTRDVAETVTASRDLTIAADVFGLDAPVMTQRGGRWYVTLRAAERPMARYSRRVTFELGSPGTVRRTAQP